MSILPEELTAAINYSDLNVDSYEVEGDFIHVHTSPKDPKGYCCPKCGSIYTSIKGQRDMKFRDVDVMGKHALVYIHTHIYDCQNKDCSVRGFVPQFEAVRAGSKLSVRLCEAILDEVKNEGMFTSVGEKYGVDASIVRQLYDDYRKTQDCAPEAP